MAEKQFDETINVPIKKELSQALDEWSYRQLRQQVRPRDRSRAAAMRYYAELGVMRERELLDQGLGLDARAS